MKTTLYELKEMVGAAIDVYGDQSTIDTNLELRGLDIYAYGKSVDEMKYQSDRVANLESDISDTEDRCDELEEDLSSSEKKLEKALGEIKRLKSSEDQS